jgi:AGCS family alanine or glycine:cation symporter
MGTFYAVGIFIGALDISNMFQSNQAYVQLNTVADGALDNLGWLVELVLVAVVSSVIIGGIKLIAKITEEILPFMAVFYCSFAIVILMDIGLLPQAIANIFSDAFTGEGVAGGG